MPSPFLDDTGLGQHVIPDLDTVSASSSDNVWAATSSGVQTAVFEHFDGTQWHVVAGPVDPSVNNVTIGSVATTGPSDAWGVGKTTGFGRRAPTNPLIEHFDGTA